MGIKSWQPAKILSRSNKAFVALDTSTSEEEDLQDVNLMAPQSWMPVQFPEVSSDDFRPMNMPNGEVEESGNNTSAWAPPEITSSFVVNRGALPRFSKSDNKRPYHSNYFDDISKQTEGIIAEAHIHAAEILANSEKQGAEILQQAENQAANLTHQAYQDGLAAANAEIGDLLRTARAIAEEVETWRENTLANGEMMMLRLVIEIAQTLFGEGLPLDPDTLGNAFSRALAQAKTLGDLRIYVHPEDSIALTPHWAQQQATFSGQRIELIPSDIIKRGGCFIEGQFGSVDARIETQLQMAKSTLLDTMSMPLGSTL